MNYTELFEQFLTPGIISILGLVIALVVQAVGRKFVSRENLAILDTIVTVAIESAEQYRKVGRLESSERRQYAYDLIMAELESRRIKMNPDLIFAVLESKVLSLAVNKEKSGS